MDLLRAEMERKRKAMDMAKSSLSSAAGDGDDDDGDPRGSARKKRKKYMNAAELRRFQEEQEEREAKERERRRRREMAAGGAVGTRREEGEGTGKVQKDEDGNNKSSPDRGDGGVRKGGGESGGDGTGGASGTTAARGGSGGMEAGGDGYVGEEAAATAEAEGKSVPKDGEGEAGVEEEEEERQPPPDEITRALRQFGLPVRLFGERTVPLKTKKRRDKDGVKRRVVISYDDTARWSRLREARELSIRHRTESTADEYALGSGHGIRNPFLDKNSNNSESAGTGTGTFGGPTSTSSAKAREASAAVASGGRRGDATEADAAAAADDDDAKADAEGAEGGAEEDDPHKRIHRFFKTQLKNWEADLAQRPDSIRRTVAGRNETKTVKQCRDYIRPLFRLLKRRQLEEGIMGHLLEIVEKCEAGEFVEAHDAYMNVAIGRAAWPIGVTMVGIHARSGRAKIESGNVAHVMNSELQRKYLTSVKRLMSYCQKKAEHVAPSKKVR